MKEELLRLADLCEKASGPNRKLDGAIAKAVGQPHGKASGFCNDENGDYWITDECAEEFTASLDAAMTLVPEGWRIAEVGETVVDCSNPWAVRLFERCKHDRDSQRTRGDAATFALALCAAALRASVKEQNNGK